MTEPVDLPVLPAEAAPCFPHPSRALDHPNGLLAVGGRLSGEWLLAAYRSGIFPWFGHDEPILWWSPDPRCLFRTDSFQVNRRLLQRLRNCGWTLHLDSDFAGVIAACAEPRPRQPGTWITAAMQAAYLQLHVAGHAHSIEVREGKQLVGGIYGVAAGSMFSGESMFSRRPDASKVALAGLCRALSTWGCPWLDAQVPNPHLTRLGAIELPRAAFLRELAELASRPPRAGAWTRLPTPAARDLARNRTIGP